MKSEYFWHTTVTFYPELIAASLKAKEWESYLLYSVFKDADRITQGRGLVRVQPALQIISDLLGIKGNHTYTKIEKGINKYWHEPGGSYKEKKFGLYNIERVVKHLQPTMPRTLPYNIKIMDLMPSGLESSSAYMKSNFVCMIASRLGENRPQSIQSIQEHTGLSRATVYNMLAKNELIETQRNYVIVQVDMQREDIMKLQRDLMHNNLGKYRAIPQDDGLYMLVAQIPNSYNIDADRGKMKQRPSPLKAFDIDNLSACAMVQYSSNSSCKPFLDVSDDELGKIKLWTSSTIQLPPIKQIAINAKSIFSEKRTTI